MFHLILLFVTCVLCAPGYSSFEHRNLQVDVLTEDTSLYFFVSCPNAQHHTNYRLNALLEKDDLRFPENASKIPLDSFVWRVIPFVEDSVDLVTSYARVYGRSEDTSLPEIIFTISVKNQPTINIATLTVKVSKLYTEAEQFVVQLAVQSKHKKKGHSISHKEFNHDVERSLIDFGYTTFNYSKQKATFDVKVRADEENDDIKNINLEFAKPTGSSFEQDFLISPNDNKIISDYMRNILLIIGVVFVIGGIVAVVFVNKMSPNRARNALALDLEELEVPLL
ncbi:hypothetical protein P9112_003192 [Eukaryota sp. TZLM1-RC]